MSVCVEEINYWTLDAECLRLTLNTFAGRALVIDDLVEGTARFRDYVLGNAWRRFHSVRPV